MAEREKVAHFFETKGEDYFDVYKRTSGGHGVVELHQYDAYAGFDHWKSIDFWADTAPRMIEAIQKAAGIEVAYEYAVEQTHIETVETNLSLMSNGRVWTKIKEHAETHLKLRRAGVLNDLFGYPLYEYKLVRRPLVEGYEVIR